MTSTRVGVAALAVYVATIFAANALIHRYGLVPHGWATAVPAGTFAAGLAFTARDVVHEHLGRGVTLAAVVVGAALSAWVSPTLAVASGVAFALGELLDLGVYSHLRDRQWDAAVLASGLVGSFADSFVFLHLAGFPSDAGSVTRLVAVKLAVTAVAWAAWRPVRPRLRVAAA